MQQVNPFLVNVPILCPPHHFHFSDENLDYSLLQTNSKWLQAIGMGQYTSNFVDKGFATPRQILELNEEDLEALSVAPIGHRKKILIELERRY